MTARTKYALAVTLIYQSVAFRPVVVVVVVIVVMGVVVIIVAVHVLHDVSHGRGASGLA